MEETLGQLQSPLHTAGEGFCFLTGTIRQADSCQHFLYARFQCGAVQSIQMPLVAQVLGCGELDVDTLGLEDDSDVTSQIVWISGGIESQDEGATRNRDHQRGKNAKK